MTAAIHFGVILAASVVIYFTSNWFASASSKIGDYFRLPRSVKGATFDAISSSLPELMIALFAVISFHRFEIGIGTIVGSALFNLLIIPGICVLVAPCAFKVSKELISRDGMFYNIAVFALLSALLYSRIWGVTIPLIFLAIYIWYIRDIWTHAKEHRKSAVAKKEDKEIRLWKEISIALSTMVLISIASYFMTKHAIGLSEALNIPVIIIAFTIIAAATSFPDTIISVANAKKGNIDDAIANVFGSNIFDILVGLSVPLLVALFYNSQVEIAFKNFEIIVGLLGATILVLYFLAKSHTLNKKQAWFMLFMYFVFLTYVIFLSMRGGV
jgi:cation:H+ antiporter